MLTHSLFFFFFFFNDTATTEIYTLSLHDALPISWASDAAPVMVPAGSGLGSSASNLTGPALSKSADRKSTRLNSSHQIISYAVFCLKKKKKQDRVKSVERRVYNNIVKRSLYEHS